MQKRVNWFLCIFSVTLFCALAPTLSGWAWRHPAYVANRPPTPFSLLLPPNGDTIRTSRPTFLWQSSSDPDPGDQVSYVLQITQDSTFALVPITVPVLGGDTAFTPPVPLFVNNFEIWFWRVIAVDNLGEQTLSRETFQFTVLVSPDTTLLPAKIVFKPERWDVRQLGAGGDDGDDDEGESEEESGAKIKCYIGNLPGHDVHEIDVATILLGDVVRVVQDRKCKSEKILPLTATLAADTPDTCFDARIQPEREGFDGAVLRVRFDREAAFRTIPPGARDGDTVFISVTGELQDGTRFAGRGRVIVKGDFPTGVPEEREVPRLISSSGAYPNPFNPSTTIRFSLLRDDFVAVSIYNLLGQRVGLIPYGFAQRGHHRVVWDAKDDSGSDLPSGVYFFFIVGQTGQAGGKMVLVR